MAPQLQIVVTEVQQDRCGGVIVGTDATQIELGKLRGEVLQRFPIRARLARQFEPFRRPVLEREAAERRCLGVPVGGFAFRNSALGIIPIDLMQIVATGIAADKLHVH